MHLNVRRVERQCLMCMVNLESGKNKREREKYAAQHNRKEMRADKMQTTAATATAAIFH